MRVSPSTLKPKLWIYQLPIPELTLKEHLIAFYGVIGRPISCLTSVASQDICTMSMYNKLDCSGSNNTYNINKK